MLKGVFNGKTAAGIIALGLVWFVHLMHTEGHIPADVLPNWLITVFGGLAAALALFGLNDAAMQAFEDWKQALVAFVQREQFWGLVIFILGNVVDQATEITDNPFWLTLAEIVSGALIVLGLKKDSIKARLNNAEPAAKHKVKYLGVEK